MADALETKFGAKAEMIEGAGGVFDVHVDGNQVWCKHDIGRFPEHDEVIDKISSVAAKS